MGMEEVSFLGKGYFMTSAGHILLYLGREVDQYSEMALWLMMESVRVLVKSSE